MTKEPQNKEPQKEDNSWKFLIEVTRVILQLPQEVQNSILELGRKLKNLGVGYVHDAERENKEFSRKQADAVSPAATPQSGGQNSGGVSK